MMKTTYLTIGSIILIAVCLPAAEPESPISNEAVRAAITTFRQDPVSAQGRDAGEIVWKFAEKNDTVLIQVTAKVTPFLHNVEILSAERTLLRDAFVVGNVDSQLSRKERKDDPYSGVLEVIRVYREMQKRDPTFKLQGIENFIELEKRGELKNYVSSP